jgi:hypothetical protein
MVGSRTIIDEVYAAAEAMSQACAKNLCEVVTRYDVIAVTDLITLCGEI